MRSNNDQHLVGSASAPFQSVVLPARCLLRGVLQVVFVMLGQVFVGLVVCMAVVEGQVSAFWFLDCSNAVTTMGLLIKYAKESRFRHIFSWTRFTIGIIGF